MEHKSGAVGLIFMDNIDIDYFTAMNFAFENGLIILIIIQHYIKDKKVQIYLKSDLVKIIIILVYIESEAYSQTFSFR